MGAWSLVFDLYFSLINEGVLFVPSGRPYDTESFAGRGSTASFY